MEPANILDHSAPPNVDDCDESGLRRIGRARAPRAVGPYLMSEAIANGGMASVHLGVVANDGRKVVALKKLHPHLLDDDYFTRMLLDEAAIAASVRHKNVVRTYGGQVVDQDHMFLVMEYVAGISLSEAIRRSQGEIAPRLAAAIVAGALRGLHAAHEARDRHGASLGIVHRDVSPQNVLIGLDGVPRVFDFGIAMAARRVQTTRAGEIKGKLAYMAPEQLLLEQVDRRVDIYAAGVVLWEAIVGGALFHAESEGATVARVLDGCPAPPSKHVPDVPPALDAVVLRALSRRPGDRFETALEMADALDAVFAACPVKARELGTWVGQLSYDVISQQAAIQVELRRHSSRPPPPVDDTTFTTHRRLSHREVGITKKRIAMIEAVAIVLLVLVAALAGALFMRLVSNRQSSPTRASVTRTIGAGAGAGAPASTVTSTRSSPRT